MRILNVGGGLGIAYTRDDDPPSIEEYVDVKVRGVRAVLDPPPRILIEPGRSLVGNAGLTVYTVGTVKQIPGVRTYIAVDGGMSDNMRPMLYGARYEALIANRAAEPRRHAGDRRRDALRIGRHPRPATRCSPRPQVGDLLVTPATGAYGYAMASNYNGLPRPGGRVLLRRGRPRGRTARDLRRPAGPRRRMSAAEPIRIGVLGRGTVGGAFVELLSRDAPTRSRRRPGAGPRSPGVLRRSEGSYDEILARLGDRRRADRGDRAGARLRAARAARRAPRGDREQAADRPARRRALRGGARGRGPDPLRGSGGRGHPGDQGDPGEPRRRPRSRASSGSSTGRPTSSSPRWRTPARRMTTRSPAPRSSVTPRPTRRDDVGGADAAAKMAILARLAFHTPVELDDVSFEGIEAIQPDDLAYAKQFGLSLKLLGVAERHAGEISVRVFPCFLYSGHPLAPVAGPFNAVMVESPSITEITMSGPGAGGTETAAAVLGDVVSIVAGDAPGARRARAPRGDPATSSRRSTSTSRSPTAPESWPRSRTGSATTRSRSAASSSGGSATTRAWSWSCTSAPSSASIPRSRRSGSSTSCAPSRARSG